MGKIDLEMLLAAVRAQTNECQFHLPKSIFIGPVHLRNYKIKHTPSTRKRQETKL